MDGICEKCGEDIELGKSLHDVAKGFGAFGSKVEAKSAFDVVEELDLGGGYIARKKSGKKAEKKEEHKVEASAIDKKELELGDGYTVRKKKGKKVEASIKAWENKCDYCGELLPKNAEVGDPTGKDPELLFCSDDCMSAYIEERDLNAHRSVEPDAEKKD